MTAENLPLVEAIGRTWDVVVVGAGPAGSMAAHALVRQGLDVLLVDQAAFPRWKVCGCCLNPFTLGILTSAGLGALVSRCQASPLHRMHLAAGHRRASVGLAGWQVLSRQRLDTALVEAAGQAGACCLFRTQAALGAEFPEGRTVVLRQENRQEQVFARLVLAADGLPSRLLLGESGCKVRSAPASRVGAGTIAETGPDFYQSGTIYMAYGACGYIGLVRLEDGRLNIAAAFDLDPLRRAHHPGAMAELLLDEVGWPAVPGLSGLRWQGTPTLTRQAARPAAARLLAVGDAAGYVEPFTGEGIGWAMASGAAVVPLAIEAVERWRPALADHWAAFQGRAEARRSRLCRAITWVSRHPAIASGLIGAVGRLPWLAAPLVSHIARGKQHDRPMRWRPGHGGPSREMNTSICSPT